MINLPGIASADYDEIPLLVNLINTAFRGETSKKGWTTEAHLLPGAHRIDVTGLSEMMQKPGALMLKYISEEGQMSGCVYLQKQNDKLYLGLLAVSQLLQAKGIGKQLVAAAELHAKEMECVAILMTVISVRQDLIAWYERHGYHKTSYTKPFPNDARFGIPTQDFELLVLEKNM